MYRLSSSSISNILTPRLDSVNLLDIMVKPDGVQRRHVGNIIHRFESKGFLLKALKLVQPSRETLEEHYRDLKAKPFFPKLMDYMSSGPVVAMVSDLNSHNSRSDSLTDLLTLMTSNRSGKESRL